MKQPFHWGLMVPPVLSLMIAGSVVWFQSGRNAKITAELIHARQEASRLTKLLPKGRTVQMQDADNCQDDHHSHPE